MLALKQVGLSLRVFSQHYYRQPLQASAILLGIILAVSLLIGVKATNENAIHSYSQATELLNQQASAYILPPAGYSSLNEQQYIKLRQENLPVLAVLKGSVLDNQGKRRKLLATDFITSAKLQKSSEFELKEIPLAKLISGQAVVLTNQTNFQSNFTLANQPTDVVIIDSELAIGEQLLADLSFAQTLLKLPEQLSYIAIIDPSSDELKRIDQLLINGNQLQMHDKGQTIGRLTDSFHLNLQAIAMLAFVVGLFIAYNGLGYSLLKRQQLIIKLLQLGISRKAALQALLVELLLLIIIGSSIGFILGLQLSNWLQPMVANTLEQIYGTSLLNSHWQWQWLAEAIILTLICATLACLPFFRFLSKQELIESKLNYQQNAYHFVGHKSLFQLACITLIGIGLLFNLSQTYQQSLLLFGLLTLTLPMLLPQLLHWLMKLIQEFSPVGLVRYMLAETKELMPSLALALMAILLALSANIAINTLISSFEKTLNHWLEQRLHADLYVRPASINSAATHQLLLSMDGIKTLDYQWEADSNILITHQIHSSKPQTEPILLLARDSASAQSTVSFKKYQADLWPDFFAGKSIMISEPLAIRHQLKLGDNLQVKAFEHLYPEGLPIQGIYYDYGKPKGEVLISEQLWHRAGLPANNRHFAITYKGDIARLENALIQAGISPTHLFNQSSINSQALEIFNRTFGITSALNSLTLLIAAIGLFTSCLMLMQSRQRALARLYALGVPRARLLRWVFAQMLLLIGITSLLALPTGALLGWLLIDKITLQAFGWTIKFIWSWPASLQAVMIAIATSLLAIAIPLYHQTQQALITRLQGEAL